MCLFKNIYGAVNNLRIFRNYHLDKVTCVDTFRQDTNVFLTGSRDKMAYVWDLRNSAPASGKKQIASRF